MSRLDDLLAKFDEIDVSEYVEFFESRKIGDDVVVHSRFKASLQGICWICKERVGSDVKECQKLFKRMLRKVERKSAR